MYIIGGIGDQIDQLVWGSISNRLFEISIPSIANHEVYLRMFRTQLAPWLSSQPIFWTFLSSLLSLFGPNFYTFFLFQTLVLNFLTSYIFFKRYKHPWVYVLIFNLSGYFWVHLGQHPALSQLWILPLTLYVFFKLFENHVSSVRRIALFGVYLAIVSLISNYLGFFLMLFLSIYVACKFLLAKRFNSKQDRRNLRDVFATLALSGLIIGLVLLPYVRANYISGQGDAIGGTRYFEIPNSLDSFQYFSSRPWYFFTPSYKNPVLGSVGGNMIEKVESTGYFLANDYFHAEHAASFFGFVFLGGLTYLFRKHFKHLNKQERLIILSLVFSTLILVTFMMPPFVTLFGFKFYTPGYLIFKFFPMFRVTARMAVLVHLCVLMILGTLLSNKKVIIKKGVLIFFVFVTLLEVYIPPKITSLASPEVYTYLYEEFSPQTSFVIYPYSKAPEAFYWLSTHQQLLVNARGDIKYQFESEKFTKALIEDGGLASLSENNVDLLIVSKEHNGEDLELFYNSSGLLFDSEVGEYVVFKVIMKGSDRI